MKNKRCEVCGKLFFLEWRLQKHLNVHTGEAKYCHYFNNQRDCPYQDIGCKFLHQQSGKCKFSNSCSNNLCQFEHAQEVPVDEASMIEDEEEILDTIDDYECHLCNEIHLCQDSLQECCSHEECSSQECHLAVGNNLEKWRNQAKVSHMPTVAGPLNVYNLCFDYKILILMGWHRNKYYLLKYYLLTYCILNMFKKHLFSWIHMQGWQKGVFWCPEH